MWLAQQKHSAGATAPLALGGGVGAVPVDCALCALVRPATPQLASVQADGQRGNGSQTDTRCARPLSAYRTPHSLLQLTRRRRATSTTTCTARTCTTCRKCPTASSSGGWRRLASWWQALASPSTRCASPTRRRVSGEGWCDYLARLWVLALLLRGGPYREAPRGFSPRALAWQRQHRQAAWWWNAVSPSFFGMG